MGRTKSAGRKSANPIVKQSLHEIKNGSVKKNKNPKFKNASVSKAVIIDNVKVQNKNALSQKSPQKNVNSKNNQNLSKEKMKQSKKKGGSPKGKQNSPSAAQNKNLNKRKSNLQPKKELAESDDSDSNIEGIIPQKYSMESVDETFEDEEKSDNDIPNILGASLAEDSDEDDEDFEDEEEMDEEEDNDDSYEEEEEEKSIEHKGVKMFKGIKSKAKNEDLDVSEDEDDDEEDDSEDDDMDETDEEIESGEINTSVSGIKNDEDEEDDEDEDSEEDEDEDSEEDENEDATLGIKALLGKTITDDDDDEDFDEDDEDDEDDDISDEDDEEENDNIVKASKEKKGKVSDNETSVNKKQTEKKRLSVEEQEEIDKRTIRIDNIPKETKEETIKKIFGQYGPINNMRFRGIVPQNPKMPKKVAAITGQTHSKVTTVLVYINYKSEESARKALSMNGKLFEGNYVNVNIVAKSEQQNRDPKKAVFIGNLKFGIDNNIIWKHFSECGEIESVHLVRDSMTGQPKGFGYVNFKSKDAVALALKLNGVEICNRPIRVSPCLNMEDKKRSNKKGQKRHFSDEDGGKNPAKKFKDNSRKTKAHSAQHEGNVKKQQKSQKDDEKVESKNSTGFQGQTADLKNKKKGNKFDKKKKVMAQKLKPKKGARV